MVLHSCSSGVGAVTRALVGAYVRYWRQPIDGLARCEVPAMIEPDDLESLADVVDSLLARCGMSAFVRGGYVYPDQIKMRIDWRCKSTRQQRIDFNRLMKRSIPYNGGIDAKSLDVILLHTGD